MSEYDKQGYLEGSDFKKGDKVIFPCDRMSDEELNVKVLTAPNHEEAANFLYDEAERARKNEASLQKDFDEAMKFIDQTAKEYGSLQGHLDQANKEIEKLKQQMPHLGQYKRELTDG